MDQQEQLFKQFQLINSKVRSLSGIVQNPQTVSYEQLEEFDRQLHRAINDLQEMRMSVIMYYKNNNLIQP